MSLLKVKEILAEIINLEPEDIIPEMKLSKEDGIEPIEVVKLIMRCEHRFKVTIHDEDVHQLKTVGDLSEYISRQLQEAPERKSLATDKSREGWHYR